MTENLIEQNSLDSDQGSTTLSYAVPAKFKTLAEQEAYLMGSLGAKYGFFSPNERTLSELQVLANAVQAGRDAFKISQ